MDLIFRNLFFLSNTSVACCKTLVLRIACISRVSQ